jgi:hypothetical protein
VDLLQILSAPKGILKLPQAVELKRSSCVNAIRYIVDNPKQYFLNARQMGECKFANRRMEILDSQIQSLRHALEGTYYKIDRLLQQKRMLEAKTLKGTKECELHDEVPRQVLPFGMASLR